MNKNLLKENRTIKKILSNKDNILFFIIILFAILIRVVNWPNGIRDINCDEAMMAVNAKSIAQTGKDIYGTKLPIYFEGWLVGGQSAIPTYLVSIAIGILGCNLLAVRLPILIISIISIIIIYLLSKEIFNKKIAIIVLLLTAINPWHIMQSQWNLDCNMFPHIFLIAIYLLCSGIKTNNKIKLYSSMIMFGISMYTYGISIFFVPLFLLVIGIALIIKKKISIKELLISSAIYILISIPILTMYIINYLKLDTIEVFGITIQRFYYSVRNEDMLIFSNNVFEQFKTNIISTIETIVLQNDDLIWNTIKGYGTVYIFSIPFIAIGIADLTNKKNKYKYGLIVLVWFVVAFFVGVMINTINVNRVNIIWYPMIILNGYGIYSIWKFLHSKKIILGIIIGIYIIVFTMFIINYYNKYQKEISNSYTFSKGFIDVVKYIEKNESDKKIIVSKDIDGVDNYIYLLYLTDEEKVSRELLIEYYMERHENHNERIILENFDNERQIDSDIYIIKNEQRDKIVNLDEYVQHRFGCYLILSKIN